MQSEVPMCGTTMVISNTIGGLITLKYVPGGLSQGHRQGRTWGDNYYSEHYKLYLMSSDNFVLQQSNEWYIDLF